MRTKGSSIPTGTKGQPSESDPTEKPKQHKKLKKVNTGHNRNAPAHPESANPP